MRPDTEPRRLRWRRRMAAVPLHHRFALVGSIVTLLGMLAVGSLVSDSIQTSVVRNAALSSAVYMESFVAPMSQELADSRGLSPASIGRMRALLDEPPMSERILSTKIWRTGGLIAFSSDPELIGKVLPPSDKLRQAWAGELSASFDDLKDDENRRERMKGVPLLEVYNPIHSIITGKIIAVAEFYLDGSELKSDLRAAHARAWAAVAAVMALTSLRLERAAPHPILICAYRFTQEALMNSWRHARGAPVIASCGLATDGRLQVAVADQGPGFDPAMRSGLGLGLSGLRERVESIGGEFQTRPAPEAVAAVETHLPDLALRDISMPGSGLHAAAEGASYVSPALAARVLAAMQARSAPDLQAVSEDLTPREATILRLLATGLSNKEIARELELQEKTIKHYMTNILQKLQVRNRVEAALKARDLGL